MTTQEILLKSYTSNNKTLKMLLELVNKWNNKNYLLTDKEWSTIKEYKSLLNSFFNDVNEIQKLIDHNNIKISELI